MLKKLLPLALFFVATAASAQMVGTNFWKLQSNQFLLPVISSWSIGSSSINSFFGTSTVNKLIVSGSATSTITGDGTASTIGGILNVSGQVKIGSDTGFQIYSDASFGTQLLDFSADSDGVLKFGGTSGNGVLLDSNTVTTDQTYTFPDKSGIIALTSDTFWRQSGSNLYTSSTSWNVGIGTTTPNELLHIYGSGVTEMRIDSTDDTARLQLRGTKSSDGIVGSLLALNKGDSIGQIEISRSGSDTAGDINFWTQPSAGTVTNRMTITSTGRVGIGTTTPAVMFHVNESGAVAARINRTNTTTYSPSAGFSTLQVNNDDTTDSNFSTLSFTAPADDGLIDFGAGIVGIYTHNATTLTTDLAFQLSSAGTVAERLRITSDGNVGIGTTTPVNKLDVNGYANFQQPYAELWDDDDSVDTITTTVADTFYAWKGATTTIVTSTGSSYASSSVTIGATSTITIGSLGAGVYKTQTAISMSTDTVNTIAHCAIFKNGTKQANSSFERKMSTPGDVGNAGSDGFVTAVNGDVLDLRCASDKAGAILTMRHVSVSVHRISK